jgi:hypothetical protein
VPTGIDAYDREKPAFDLLEPVDLGPGLSPRKEAVADALQQQESKLQKFDWEGLGVKSPETLRLMRQFESGVGRGVVRLLDAMVGGMGFCFAQVSARFAYAASKLEEPAVQADPAVYAFWHEIFISCAKEMKGFNKEATGAAHTRLLIADRAQKMQGAADKMRKPGWRRVTPAATDGKAADG